MENQPRTTTISASAGRRDIRRADEFSGYVFLGLSLAVAMLTLIWDEHMIPVWAWGILLVVWCVSLHFSVSDRLSRTAALLFYGCALLSSWGLMLTVSSSNSMIVMLLIAVAAVGSYMLPMRWVLGVVALNCLVSFVHMQITGADLPGALTFTIFYLIIHLAVVFTAYAMARENQLRAELEQKNLQLEAAAVLLEDSAASSERLRISRELHDLIGHQLTVLNLELEAAKHRDGAQARQHIDQAADVAKGLLADVRTTVGELRQDSPGDLQQSLQRLAGAVPSLETHVEVDAEVQTDEESSAVLLRAAQEIITNTIKHAEATELALTVTLDESTLTLTGTNDGAAPRTITLGHGLTGLRERLEMLGGTLEIHTTPNFTVEARLPMTYDRPLKT